MKKLCQIAALFLCLSLAFINTGCDKEQDDNPVNPITPTLTTNPVSDKTVPIGCNDSISWETQGISSLVVKINGEMVSTLLKGSIKFSSITEEKIVEFEIPDNKDMNKTVRLMPQSISYPKPTINLSKNPDRLPENGGQVTITWTTTNADSVLHNSVWYPANWSIQYTISQATTFVFIAKGKGGETSGSITIEPVVTPPPTQEEILCANPRAYYKEEYKYLDPGSEWIDNFVTDCQKDNVLLFNINHTAVLDYGQNLCGQTQQAVNFTWTLENGHVDGKEIEYLTVDTLMWTYPSIEILPDGVTTIDIIIRETWVNKP